MGPVCMTMVPERPAWIAFAPRPSSIPWSMYSESAMWLMPMLLTEAVIWEMS